MPAVDIFCSAASVLLLWLCDSSDLCTCAVNLDCVNSCCAILQMNHISHFHFYNVFVIVFDALTQN